MKKVALIVLAAVLAVVLGFGGYFAYRTNIANRDTKDVLNELGAQMNMTSEFQFVAPKVKEKTKMVPADSNYTTVPLYLGGGMYYNIRIPADVGIVTDYATYIYGTDMSFRVAIVKNVDTMNIAGSLAMSDAIAYDAEIWTSKTGKKEPQEVGRALIDDLGVLGITYDSPQTYATILNGFEHERVRQYSVSNILGDTSTEVCNSVLEIPYEDTGAANSLLSDAKSAGACMYYFDDGWLTEFNATRGHDDVKADLSTRVMLASNERAHVDRMFAAENEQAKFYYAEVGRHTILCVSDTVNHTYACLGSGATARNNIVMYLRSVYSR